MNEKEMINEELHYSQIIEEENICTRENIVYEKPDTLLDTPMHYCPGCGHGVVHRLIAEVIDELGIQSETIGVAPVGCSVFAYNYLNIDMTEAAHGRASAVATGIKACSARKICFLLSGGWRPGSYWHRRNNSYLQQGRKPAHHLYK